MKKRIFLFLIALLVLVGLGTACSNNVNTSSQAASNHVLKKGIIKRKRSKNKKRVKGSLERQIARINIHINGQTLHATLNNSSAARAFAKELPVTLSFRDFMTGFPEKIADLHHGLPTKEMPRGHEGTKGTIGYWSPDQRIVFYYGTESYYDGIHIIGKFTSKNYAKAIKNMGNHVPVRITKAK